MFKKVGCFLSLKPLMNRCREKSFMVLKQLLKTNNGLWKSEGSEKMRYHGIITVHPSSISQVILNMLWLSVPFPHLLFVALTDVIVNYLTVFCKCGTVNSENPIFVRDFNTNYIGFLNSSFISFLRDNMF